MCPYRPDHMTFGCPSAIEIYFTNINSSIPFLDYLQIFTGKESQQYQDTICFALDGLSRIPEIQVARTRGIVRSVRSCSRKALALIGLRKIALQFQG
jgi:hypothetical protein